MPIAHNVRLSQIATAWHAQPDLIADQVLPPVLVPDVEFERTDWTRDWKIPETLTGKTSQVSRVAADSSLSEERVDCHALIGTYALEDVNRQNRRPPNERADVRGITALQTRHLLALAREKRASDLVFAAGSYNTGMKSTLSGTSQWSSDDSDPIGAVAAAAEKFVGMPPNTMVIGSEVYAKLRRHPDVIEAYRGRFSGNAAQKGLVGAEEMAAVFGVSRVLVGMSRYDSAAVGATESLARTWGKYAALLYVAKPASMMDPTPVFGCSPMVEQLRVEVFEGEENRKIGSDGIGEIKVTQWCSELIVSKECGYLFSSAVA